MKTGKKIIKTEKEILKLATLIVTSAASGTPITDCQRKMASQVQKAQCLLVIELAGPISWPPSSPDLTPCDFYLWVYLKDQVYQPPDATVASRANFTAIANVDESQSRRSWEAFKYRVDVCTVN
jgi:hypothetical protein